MKKGTGKHERELEQKAAHVAQGPRTWMNTAGMENWPEKSVHTRSVLVILQRNQSLGVFCRIQNNEGCISSWRSITQLEKEWTHLYHLPLCHYDRITQEGKDLFWLMFWDGKVHHGKEHTMEFSSVCVRRYILDFLHLRGVKDQIEL